MSAGTSATATPTPGTGHYVTPELPYKPRALSRGEATSREIFVFYSPRNQRIVTVCEYLHLALAMQLEFTPTLTTYVERPCRLALGPKQTIDVAFWTRDKSGESGKTGQERFLLAIPKAGTVGNARDSTALRDRARMEGAAERHGIHLTYIVEQELLAASTQLRTHFLLLPHVQSARRVLARTTIRQGLLAYFNTMPRASFQQLTAAFDNFSPDHVVAVAAAMVHEGGLRLVDSAPLSLHTMLEVTHAA
ncbi:hypothetical protein EAH75_04855 [Rhodanobacter glycinis]|uniref:hypothetical protein n=1 Tax=Rhodanobacter glycinis TaxID=582702 RepID=UPI00112E4C5E|nr:hypothetical protein [Rhodanobacter glycinis]TPG50762.1 hypothetical protein EAH75_04855 [Rhodanobacter glycinis]